MPFDDDHDKPAIGSSWSNAGGVMPAPPMALDQRQPLTLTLTGNEEEIRSYLDGPRLAALIADLDEAMRAKLKHSHDFKTAEEAMEWVRGSIAEREL